MRFIFIAAIGLFFPLHVSAVCLGCNFASTYGTVTKGYEKAAKRIAERFDELEETFSKKYKEDILPLVEAIRDIEEELMVTTKQIEMMQKVKLLYENEISQLVREIKLIDSTLDFTLDLNSEKRIEK